MSDIVLLALKEYATHEHPGVASNVRIQQYFREVGRPEWKSDEIPWCACFINWLLVQIGAPTCGRGLAESFTEYGTETKTPELGDIVVFIGNRNPGGVNHVALFIRKVDDRVYFLGGNQSDQVNIESLPASYVETYRKIPKGIRPDDPRNKFNTATGELNPNYNPNA